MGLATLLTCLTLAVAFGRWRIRTGGPDAELIRTGLSDKEPLFSYTSFYGTSSRLDGDRRRRGLAAFLGAAFGDAYATRMQYDRQFASRAHSSAQDNGELPILAASKATGLEWSVGFGTALTMANSILRESKIDHIRQLAGEAALCSKRYMVFVGSDLLAQCQEITLRYQRVLDGMEAAEPLKVEDALRGQYFSSRPHASILSRIAAAAPAAATSFELLCEPQPILERAVSKTVVMRDRVMSVARSLCHVHFNSIDSEDITALVLATVEFLSGSKMNPQRPIALWADYRKAMSELLGHSSIVEEILARAEKMDVALSSDGVPLAEDVVVSALVAVFRNPSFVQGLADALSIDSKQQSEKKSAWRRTQLLQVYGMLAGAIHGLEGLPRAQLKGLFAGKIIRNIGASLASGSSLPTNARHFCISTPSDWLSNDPTAAKEQLLNVGSVQLMSLTNPAAIINIGALE